MSEHESVWDEMTAKGKVVMLFVLIVFSPILLLLKLKELIEEEIVKWDSEQKKLKEKGEL